MEIFLEKFIEILDTESEVTMDSMLSEIEEWDSLSIVSFLAMANSVYGKKIKPDVLIAAKSVRDLYALVQ